MKVAFINTFDRLGGATQSCRRTALALRAAEVDVRIVAQEQTQPDEMVVPAYVGWQKYLARFREYGERLRFVPREASRAVRFQFSFDDLGQDISKLPFIQEADVLHFHWISRAYLSLQSFQALARLNKPMVWSLHDMWAFTGGCHYAGSCTHFQKACGNCWHLKRPAKNDISHQIWTRKAAVYPGLNMTYVGSSAWLAGIAKTSSLLGQERVINIPTPVEQDIFCPMEKADLRRALTIGEDRIVLLFVAMNVQEKRKGFAYIKEALDLLAQSNSWIKEKVELLVLGRAQPADFADLPFPVHCLGRLSELPAIAKAYNTADVFLMPSLEDNLPNTVLESLSCGIPVVAFDTGGIPEMVAHQKNGYIAESQNARQLVEGIQWVLENPERYQQLSQAARATILNDYSYEKVAAKYLELYTQLLNKK